MSPIQLAIQISIKIRTERPSDRESYFRSRRLADREVFLCPRAYLTGSLFRRRVCMRSCTRDCVVIRCVPPAPAAQQEGARRKGAEGWTDGVDAETARLLVRAVLSAPLYPIESAL